MTLDRKITGRKSNWKTDTMSRRAPPVTKHTFPSNYSLLVCGNGDGEENFANWGSTTKCSRKQRAHGLIAVFKWLLQEAPHLHAMYCKSFLLQHGNSWGCRGSNNLKLHKVRQQRSYVSGGKRCDSSGGHLRNETLLELPEARYISKRIQSTDLSHCNLCAVIPSKCLWYCSCQNSRLEHNTAPGIKEPPSRLWCSLIRAEVSEALQFLLQQHSLNWVVHWFTVIAGAETLRLLFFSNVGPTV